MDWKPIAHGDIQSAPSQHIQHCEYWVKNLGRETGQWEARQFWTGKNTRVPLKITRCADESDAKEMCEKWDSAYER